MKEYNYINNSNNHIKKSNSFSSVKKDNNYNLNLTYTEFPKNNNFLINQNCCHMNNKKFNSTLTEWRNNNINIHLNNTKENNNNNTKLKNNHFNSSAPDLNNYNMKKDLKKKSLILDLDETLVHSSFYPFERVSDLTLPITVDNQKRIVYILRRPYVIEFMKEMSSYYEIIIYTASISDYASKLLDELDKYKVVSKRYYRNNCIYNKGIYIKDLRIIGKPFKDLIIIDNNPISYLFNINNGLPILSWYGDSKDIELLKLIPLLKYLSNVEDVTCIIPKIVNRDKNKIKFSFINKLINHEKSNLNNNINNNFGGNLRQNLIINENVIHNNYDNNKNNNDNGSPNNYLNYINNLPNSKSLNKCNQNHALNNQNNKDIIYNNNSCNLNKNNLHFENPNRRNYNESNELRDSVFSPEEPNLNINNIQFFQKEIQMNNDNNKFNKTNNICYKKISNEYNKTDNEYLNRTPIVEKKNNKSYTPDLEIQRSNISRYKLKENYNKNNKCNIERNTFNPINNQHGQRYKNVRCNCNINNKNFQNNGICPYNNKNNVNSTQNNQSNNFINQNIMKYFIPTPKLEKKNNDINNEKLRNKKNINISYNFDNNRSFDNNNIKIIQQKKINDNKDLNLRKDEKYNDSKHKENGANNNIYIDNKNQINNYQNNNILSKSSNTNINFNNYNNYNNYNMNLTDNIKGDNNTSKIYRPKSNLNYCNIEDININIDKRNNNLNYYNKNNNSFYLNRENQNNSYNNENSYSEKLKIINNKINEIRNTLNKTECMLKERKEKSFITDNIETKYDYNYIDTNQNSLNIVSNNKKYNINGNFNDSKGIYNYNNYNNLMKNNMKNENDFNLSNNFDDINSLNDKDKSQNNKCPSLNELIYYQNYSINNKDTKDYDNNNNQYYEEKNRNHTFNDLNLNYNIF